MQVQHGFSGVSLPNLAELGLEVYDLIPDFKDRCPLCHGVGCVVRHGLYYRRVIDCKGIAIEAFPIPRFRCRRYGPHVPEAVTFSVLPAELVTRRLCSLPFMLTILELFLVSELSMHQVLDAIADSFHAKRRLWVAEATTIYRMMRLLVRVYGELGSHSLPGVHLENEARPRARARAIVCLLSPIGRSSPVVLAFHNRYFPRLLLAPPPSAD